MNLFEPSKLELPEGMTHFVYATTDMQLSDVIETGEISHCSFYTTPCDIPTWVLVGYANIQCQQLKTESIRQNLVENLESQIKGIEANAYSETTRLRGKIQQLLAIEYKEPDNDSSI